MMNFEEALDMKSEDEGVDLFDEKSSKCDDSRSKSQEQVDRRREKNRVLARKTRQRKKIFYESLQRQVAQLVKENEILKGIVQSRRGNNLESIENPLVNRLKDQQIIIKSDQPSANLSNASSSILEKADYRLISAIQAAQRSFCITNPALPDNPIVFASKGFMELTGYRADQILGRNCRFLQGPGTDKRQISALGKGIAAGADTSVCLLNYRADGSTFYNQMFVAALRNKDSVIVNYVGVQMEVQVQSQQSQSQSKSLLILPVEADVKASSMRIKLEKKDGKDEDKDYFFGPTISDPMLLERCTAVSKHSESRSYPAEEMSFDFDDFLEGPT